MDTVTQCFLGATIAHIGFNDKVGPKAAVAGALCAALPDLDLLARVFGPWASMRHHRAESHSLIILTLVTPLVALAVRRFFRESSSLWNWTALCWWALVTHPILDWFTTYGTQLLSPFSRHRFALDAVAVADPAVTFILLVGILSIRYFKDNPKLQKRVPKMALALALLYIAAGYAGGRFVEERFRQLLIAKHVDGVIQIRATPTILNIFLWHVVVLRTDGRFVLGQMSLLAPSSPGFHHYKTSSSPLVKKVLKSKEGSLFTWFAQGLVSAKIDGRTVQLIDHRYGMPSSPMLTPFRCSFEFDEKGEILKAWRSQGPRVNTSIQNEFRQLWSRAWYGVPTQTIIGGS